MTQPNPAAKQFIDDYLKAHGYGLYLPGQPLRTPVIRTGNPVQDYVAAAGFGIAPKKAKRLVLPGPITFSYWSLHKNAMISGLSDYDFGSLQIPPLQRLDYSSCDCY